VKVDGRRKQKMIRMRLSGSDLAAIGIKFGVSKQRVSQILADVKFKQVVVLDEQKCSRRRSETSG
jgi:DNA-directed RNA polymerase sigma subunit (sigma70/sigma32)